MPRPPEDHDDREDDRPRRRREPEDDDYDEPRARRRRPAGEDDWDRFRRRRRRDDDEDYDDYRPRRKSNKALIIALIAGGSVVLVGGIVLVLILVLGGSNIKGKLVGTWKDDGGIAYEFSEGDALFIKPPGDREVIRATYKVTGNVIEFRLDDPGGKTYVDRQKAEIKEGELIFSYGAGAKGMPTKLQRVR